jgi:hypothetical protein
MTAAQIRTRELIAARHSKLMLEARDVCLASKRAAEEFRAACRQARARLAFIEKHDIPGRRDVPAFPDISRIPKAPLVAHAAPRAAGASARSRR